MQNQIFENILKYFKVDGVIYTLSNKYVSVWILYLDYF